MRNLELKELESHFGVDLSLLYDKYPVPVGDICQALGIDVVFDRDMDKLHSGKIEFKNERYTITVNDNNSYYHIVFTIAHELGHYHKHLPMIKQRGFFERKYASYNEDEIEMERQANSFAADLLMPQDKFIKVFFEADGDLKYVQNFFQVSLDAIKNRANNLGLVLST